MTPPENIEPLLKPLAAVQKLIERFQDKGVVIGGVAASLLGKPRLTADVDAVILLSTQELSRLMEAAVQEGFSLRYADAEAFAQRNRVLLLRHEASGINVDISLGILPFETEAVARSQLRPVGEIALRLPTPEDLIIFKAIAHRPKDLLDIQAIIESHSNLNRSRVTRWVREFAQVLEMPELWDDIAPWL